MRKPASPSVPASFQTRESVRNGLLGSSATVLGWSSGAVAEPDPSTVLCYADTYAINPSIWNVLSAADRGCLAAPTG